MLTLEKRSYFSLDDMDVFELARKNPESLVGGAMNVTLDLSDTTQYGESFSVSELRQDGNTTGRLVGIEVDPQGVVFAVFSNGISQGLGQVAQRLDAQALVSWRLTEIFALQAAVGTQLTFSNAPQFTFGRWVASLGAVATLGVP